LGTLTYNVAALAGRRLYLYFGVHGDGRAGHYTYQYVDDISLTGAAPPRAGGRGAGGACAGAGADTDAVS
jgi:hypothetical protein